MKAHSDEHDIPNRLSDINNVPLFFHFARLLMLSNGTHETLKTSHNAFDLSFLLLLLLFFLSH